MEHKVSADMKTGEEMVLGMLMGLVFALFILSSLPVEAIDERIGEVLGRRLC